MKKWLKTQAKVLVETVKDVVLWLMAIMMSVALELKEDYLKAYVRRAQAREAFEKYEEALEGLCIV